MNNVRRLRDFQKSHNNEEYIVGDFLLQNFKSPRQALQVFHDYMQELKRDWKDEHAQFLDLSLIHI